MAPGSTLGRLRWSVGAGRKPWEFGRFFNKFEPYSIRYNKFEPYSQISRLENWFNPLEMDAHRGFSILKMDHGELWELHSKCTIFVSVNHCAAQTQGRLVSALAIFLILSAAVGREVSTTILYEVQPAWKKKTTRFMGSPHRFRHKIPFDHNPFNWT